MRSARGTSPQHRGLLGRGLLILAMLVATVLAVPADAVRPSAGHLIYSADRIYSLQSDGSHNRTLQGVSGLVSGVHASPDGNWIAFTREPSGLGNANLSEVWVARSDLTDAQAVGALPGLILSEPTWSPDSKRLAFVVGYPAGYFGIGYQAHLWVMNRDGSGKRPVVALPGAVERPTWSPRGDQVAFIVDGQEAGPFIGVVSVDATTPVPRTVSPPGIIGVGAPQWSPTGTALSFMDASSLYIVRADGSGLRRVADGNNSFWNSGAVWSPNGRELAYCLASASSFFGASGRGPYVVTIASSSPPRLLDDAPCFAPVWSPNGRSLAYLRSESSGTSLTVRRLDSSESHELTPASGFALAWIAH